MVHSFDEVAPGRDMPRPTQQEARGSDQLAGVRNNGQQICDGDLPPYPQAGHAPRPVAGRGSTGPFDSGPTVCPQLPGSCGSGAGASEGLANVTSGSHR